ncbi:hydroxyacid dehydrogenase [Candidatus Woesearchaeota archaeon]|nr:hydroxyacid dehydrogenase [Candidatus Woesearchaeota archaeon]
MKISCFLIEPWQESILKNKFNRHNVQIYREPLNSENIKENKDADIIITRARMLDLKFDKNTLEKLPNLKMISTMSTGIDHIDLDECEKRGIIVANAPEYGQNTIAEYVFALLFSISRKMPETLVKKDPDVSEIEGFDLKGKTLGVIGTGKIGMNVIKIASGIGMNILAYDIIEDKEAQKRYGFSYVESIEKLLTFSDIITLHAPYNKKTHHLLNKKNMRFIKHGAVLINTARAGLIETKALLESIEKGRISYAALDVLNNESKDIESMPEETKELIKKDNVIVTPHNASNTKEAKNRMLNSAIKNIDSYIERKEAIA